MRFSCLVINFGHVWSNMRRAEKIFRVSRRHQNLVLENRRLHSQQTLNFKVLLSSLQGKCHVASSMYNTLSCNHLLKFGTYYTLTIFKKKKFQQPSLKRRFQTVAFPTAFEISVANPTLVTVAFPTAFVDIRRKSDTCNCRFADGV